MPSKKLVARKSSKKEATPKVMTADDHRMMARTHSAKASLHHAKAELLEAKEPPKKNTMGIGRY